MFLKHLIFLTVIGGTVAQSPYNYNYNNNNYYRYSSTYGNYYGNVRPYGSYVYPTRTYSYYNYANYYPQQRYQQPYSSNYESTNPTNIAYHSNVGNVGVGNGIASFWLSCSSHNCQG